MKRHCWLSAIPLFLLAGQATAQQLETEIVLSSIDVLDDLVASPDRGIPSRLLREAHAVAVFPHVIKAGFVIGGRHGRGLMSVRREDGNWSNPVFLSITGGSVGFQIGAQSTDLVLVFRTRNGVDSILAGRNKIRLGGDLSIAAGPVGRETGAGTDARLRSEIFSYSRSRGLFAGASLEGAGIRIDWISNEAYYQSDGFSPRDIVTRTDIPTRESALQLVNTLHAIAGPEIPATPPTANEDADPIIK